MNLHKHQLYLLEQHSESFKIWSAIIRINTKGNSSIMKLGPYLITIITPTNYDKTARTHTIPRDRFDLY